MAEQQHEALKQGHLDQHEARAQHTEIRQPAGPLAAAKLVARDKKRADNE